jgi:YegS/Rv2252/BmrU family lipid kinase
MSRKILFFINPISGGKKKLLLEKKIIKKCEEKDTTFEILFTSKDGDYNFLREKIDVDGITDIAIAGGDGSIAPIVASILNVPVNIGIIPLGSGNGLANTTAIPKSVDKAIDVIITGNACFADAFIINNKFSTHVCGLGFDAKVAHDFARHKKRGLNSYTKLAVKNFLSAKTFHFIVEANDMAFDVDAFLICVANSNQFGNNFKIAPRASISDGLLDIVILKKSSKPRAVFSFVNQILTGKVKSIHKEDFQEQNVLYFQSKKIRIKNPGLALLHIDGDPAETAEEFLIEILPAAYKLIQPQSK